MPTTARRHFNEDIKRAEDLYTAAAAIPPANAALAEDQFRGAVVMAVGAMDAYLCDAYVDCLAKALKACRTTPGTKLPGDYAKELLPAGPLMNGTYTRRANWALRVAARRRMDRENMLQVGRVKDMLNPVLPANQKLWLDMIDKYVALNRKRLTGINQAEMAAVPANQKDKAKKAAAAALLRRVGEVVQRRHDIAQNCDRPKVAMQGIDAPQTKKMIADIKAFVTILDDHITQHSTV
ncbi:MAG: hypothetical protein ACK6CU_26805 [Deltaproteobacteria bacterium]|jgi:hypothetical protein